MSFWLTRYVKSMGENLGVVTSDLWRSAELSAKRLRQLRDEQDVRLMLNLQDDLPREEREEIAAAGIELAWVPMRDDAAPSVLSIKDALAVLRRPELKLVCCKGGRHRTGLIVAVYRVAEQGWTREEAWREAEKFGWYSAFGHKPLKDWFFEVFRPEDFR